MLKEREKRTEPERGGQKTEKEEKGKGDNRETETGAVPASSPTLDTQPPGQT